MKEHLRKVEASHFKPMTHLDNAFITKNLLQKLAFGKAYSVERKRQRVDVIPSSTSSPLFFNSNILSKQPFLLNTGAKLTIIEVTPAHQNQSQRDRSKLFNYSY
ncbi:unnamed protein product [Lepeophtheirus salmonis]|uniref:(salmon louse) hypothetical protein n=1 Tax=Lepeophtheirus salmonis TaxID=72036 RepID=A0A7R8HDK0_LEPSM|nr:unnamed protein product [Lepeophtheirus salmonis]CAF3024885.1 unnamed protein product [Lepeophtheirus salmonis]